MGVLDDPAGFYIEPQADWSLGDIVVVPTGVFWATAERLVDPYPQPAPPADGSQSVAYHLWRPPAPGLSLPTPVVEAWLTPAVIVVDDCVLDGERQVSARARRTLGPAVTPVASPPTPAPPVGPAFPARSARR